MPLVVQSYTCTSFIIQQLPDDLVWYILQFVHLPNELYNCMCVSRQWYSVMHNNDLFWKEKLINSNWLLNSISPNALVVNVEEYKEELRKEQEQEEEDKRNKVKSKRKKTYFVAKCGISFLDQPNTITLRSFNYLIKQWFNDWISYWTSNFIYSDSENENEGVESSNVYVFEKPLRLWQCGVAHFPIVPPSLGRNRQRFVRPPRFQTQDSVFVKDSRYRYCYEDLNLYVLLNQSLLQEQMQIFKILNDEGEEDDHLLQEARQKYYTWKDGSNTNRPSYPLIPFISFNYQQDEITFDDFCTHIRVHKELYSNNETYTWKSVNFDENNQPIEFNQNEEHPIIAAGETIRLCDIFSDQINRPYYNWIKSHLHSVKFAVLGSTQLNPVPVFIVGKTRNGNLAGFCTATFRVPHQ
jgi:hypothetical protein